jgi:ectoine hydroxylase-related dioxygenase (phytanoyl-CoA dioxygenase family)
MQIYDYDKHIFNFAEVISSILEVNSLGKLHDFSEYDVLTREKDQSTDWHRKYYKNFESVRPLYEKFVREFVKPLFGGGEIVYQSIPTFRVQLVGNVGVGAFHKDRDYNHGTSEVNFWLPFVDVWGNNSVWVESEEDRADYHPVKMSYGQLLKFDGANLMHGNRLNDTFQTRVSFDFRVVPIEKFKPSSKVSINMNSKFDIGSYFKKM